jgi:hypothetical protein
MSGVYKSNSRSNQTVVIVLTRLIAAGVAAMISLALSSELLAGGEWPDGPNKPWFQNLQRPDNNQQPQRQSAPKSLSCCGMIP